MEIADMESRDKRHPEPTPGCKATPSCSIVTALMALNPQLFLAKTDFLPIKIEPDELIRPGCSVSMGTGGNTPFGFSPLLRLLQYVRDYGYGCDCDDDETFH
ncbi:unnamed protein product [Phyllotreta striolata]|uniref:Uncharacterized protein n=1 Tax=Phyllotreta striolata TaxID=444603 RepID=A0A9N9TUG3_PHYSR|nr:unnamed protein product [Phyllotreta striolata]